MAHHQKYIDYHYKQSELNITKNWKRYHNLKKVNDICTTITASRSKNNLIIIPSIKDQIIKKNIGEASTSNKDSSYSLIIYPNLINLKI